MEEVKAYCELLHTDNHIKDSSYQYCTVSYEIIFLISR